MRCVRALLPFIALAGCSSDGQIEEVPRETELRVYSSPYRAVDWVNDLRLIAQHHDHVGASINGILAYDAAGYDVMSLMDYSGDPNFRAALRQRLWPVRQFVPESLLPSLKNIKLFLPNAEESGLALRPGEQLKHVTSPFLETYIEGTASPGLPAGSNQYTSLEQLFGLVRDLGGTPCLAHPWNFRYDELELGDSYCVEIYSAFAAAFRERNVPYYTNVDRNKVLVDYWDGVLLRNQRVYAIAVNDHFGPQALGPLSPEVRDSGKILVLAREATLPSYRESFNSGRYFAVVDRGAVKGRYPRIHSIDVQNEVIYLETEGDVTWVANGQRIATGPLLSYRTLEYGVTYVRAEVADTGGSVVYTQAFAVRPRGDVNGDYQVDAADESFCARIASGGTADADHRLACEARRRR